MLVILSICSWGQGQSAFLDLLIPVRTGHGFTVHRPIVHCYALGSVYTDGTRMGYDEFSGYLVNDTLLSLLILSIFVRESSKILKILHNLKYEPRCHSI